MRGVISFDLDGVLANFTLGYTRIAHTLFGTPVCDSASQQSWMFEDFPELELDKSRCDAVWAIVRDDPKFWATLDPYSVSVMDRVHRIKNKIFITNRSGLDPEKQSIDFLETWGVAWPKVIVAKNKGPVAIQENVVAHLDDYYPNCLDLRAACPDAYTALLFRACNMGHHPQWTSQYQGDIVLSVDHFIDSCDLRGLTEY